MDSDFCLRKTLAFLFIVTGSEFIGVSIKIVDYA